jgi:VanZ family protein
MDRFYKASLAIYFTVLAFAVFTPRPDLVQPSSDPILNPSSGTLPSLGHHILYLGGPLAWCGNAMMLMPAVFLLKKVFPTLKAQTILLIGISVTITIEFIQIYIPGRVSDVRDIVANTSGVIIALAIQNWLSKTSTISNMPSRRIL